MFKKDDLNVGEFNHGQGSLLHTRNNKEIFAEIITHFFHRQLTREISRKF